MPLDRMRHLLSRSGHGDLTRLDDYQVRHAALRLVTSGASLHTVSDIRTVIGIFVESPFPDRIGLRQLFDRAIALLDFRVDTDKGLVYAGQYKTYLDIYKPPDSRLTEEIRAAAPLPAGAADKTTIAHTPGGRWLLPWNLPSLVGSQEESAIWARATGRFIDALKGEVQVLLPLAEFEEAMKGPWHPIYDTAGVKKVVYFLDGDWRRLLNPPKELFGIGIAKKLFGRNVVFRAKK